MARAFDVLAYLFKAMYSFTSLIIYNSIAVATPIRHLMLDHWRGVNIYHSRQCEISEDEDRLLASHNTQPHRADT